MKKWKDSRGETLVESLAGILIISLVFVFLCSAIVAAARSNAQVREMNKDFSYSDMVPRLGTMQVVEQTQGGSIASVYKIVRYHRDPTLDSQGDGGFQSPDYRYYTLKPEGTQ